MSCECKAKGVSTVLFNHLYRINGVPQRLRHLTALRVANQTVDVNRSERNITFEFQTHHDHTCNPEEDNIVTSYQVTSWVERFQCLSFIRPTHSRERPKSRRKPSVQNVFVLAQVMLATFRTSRNIRFRNVLMITVIAIPNWNTVPPPQLARDTPVFDIV